MLSFVVMLNPLYIPREFILFLNIFIATFAWTATAQIEPLPSVLQTSYVTSDPLGRRVKISFRPERGKLVAYEEWADGKQNTIEISWPNIVAISVNDPLPGGKWSVMIQQNSSGIRYIPFNSKDDAVSAAGYFAKLSGVKVSTQSELSSSPSISASDGYSAAPNAFSCPPGTPRSCDSFKDLLDHGDSEILAYLHPKNSERVVACFSTEGENKFFVTEYSPPPIKRGSFSIVTFENGVRSDSDLAYIRWMSDELAVIEPVLTIDVLDGSITNAEFEYYREFTNVKGGKTKHSIAIRWSTGKYVEKYIAPGEKGQVSFYTLSGVCVHLS
jgi:hypothetical protein